VEKIPSSYLATRRLCRESGSAIGELVLVVVKQLQSRANQMDESSLLGRHRGASHPVQNLEREAPLAVGDVVQTVSADSSVALMSCAALIVV
jgi:hypothetical protein